MSTVPVPGERKILIADDDPFICEVLSRWLGQAGFAIATAVDGDEACESADAVAPDIVLLDLLLPRRDGYTVLFHLRSREATRRTPVIFISAEPSSEHEELALSLGAQGFISKPFDLGNVLACVNGALAAAARPDSRR